jgi:hypothetical protein
MKKPIMQRPEPQDWALESLLPLEPRVKKLSPEFLERQRIEEGKLKRTRDFGGLVPEPSEFLERLVRQIGPLKHEDKKD